MTISLSSSYPFFFLIFFSLSHNLSWLHQNGAEKHSLVTEIPIGATVITIGDHGEGLQVLHYEEGQKYEPHYDYFVDEFNTKNEGQRMATMLMYLADVEEGGETVFPAANMNFSSVPWYNELSACGKKGLSVKPRMGDALLFWSMRPDATLDPSNLHGGCPVIRGNKWSSTRPTVDNKPPSKGKNRTGIIVGVIVGLGLLSILAGVGIFIIRKRRNPYTDDDELLSMEIKPFTFTYSELKSATQDFNLSNKLGEGGFEPVYKVSPIPKYLHIRTNSNGSVFFKNLTSRGPLDKKVIQWLLSLHQIGLDVNRTDRSLEFYEKKENLSKLWDILSVYAWIDQDVDYCQGMSDLCSPMIVVLEDEADSFFCFERLMCRLRGNFRSTGRSVGVEAQLTHLFSITHIIDTKLHQHLGITTTTTSSLPLYIRIKVVVKVTSSSDENCRVTTEGTLTRRFWRVNKVVVKVTSSSDSDSVSDSGEKRRSKSTTINLASQTKRVDPPTNVVRKKSGTNMMNKEQVGRRGMILMLPSLNLRMRNNSCAANDDKIRKEMWTMWSRVF
ncbi:hypothetical protein HID58_028885 [Brassica napus]|uniref:Procollagen-proline 4-dioxygenase n=1 Tax=Brassica napus TaxID=3708 RepID=A0ABQ8CBI5_BRANA|nr:hypothetical protein HID58_028885 [Brassica napus]